jgi:hypothetical protein
VPDPGSVWLGVLAGKESSPHKELQSDKLPSHGRYPCKERNQASICSSYPAKPLVDNREKLKTKAEIMQALKDSFAQAAHAYINAVTPENAFLVTANGTRAGMAAFGMAHFVDHYGQMVERHPAARKPRIDVGDISW